MRAGLKSEQSRDSLMDFVYIGIVLVFFILSFGLIRLCGGLKGGGR